MAYKRVQDSEAAIHAKWVTESPEEKSHVVRRRIDELIDEAFPKS